MRLIQRRSAEARPAPRADGVVVLLTVGSVLIADIVLVVAARREPDRAWPGRGAENLEHLVFLAAGSGTSPRS